MICLKWRESRIFQPQDLTEGVVALQSPVIPRISISKKLKYQIRTILKLPLPQWGQNHPIVHSSLSFSVQYIVHPEAGKNPSWLIILVTLTSISNPPNIQQHFLLLVEILMTWRLIPCWAFLHPSNKPTRGNKILSVIITDLPYCLLLPSLCAHSWSLVSGYREKTLNV